MRLTAENKEKVRDKILESAAIVFRRDGYDAVNIDKVMSGAGLTRGAFYAHFTSKAALFAEVVAHCHPLKVMLARRSTSSQEVMLEEMLDVFEGYLTPANLNEVFAGCTIASLTGDASRANDAVRAGYQAGWSSVLSQMARGLDDPDLPQLRAALALAAGAVTQARSCASPSHAAEILDAARPTVRLLLRAACAQS